MVSKWWHEYQVVIEVVVVDDASVAKMIGGVVDVELYLDSRNTKGYGTALKFSNLEVANVSESETVQKWLGYAEVVEVCGSIYGIW